MSYLNTVNFNVWSLKGLGKNKIIAYIIDGFEASCFK